MQFIFKMVSKYVFTSRKYFSGFISVVSITIGSAIIISMFFISDNFKNVMSKKILGFHGHVSIVNQKGDIDNYEDYIAFLKNIVKSIEIDSNNLKTTSVFPVVKQQVIISGKEATGAMFYGIEYDDLILRPLISSSVSDYAKEQFKNNQNVIIIGIDMMKKIGAKIGDKIAIVCPSTKTLDLSTSIQPKIKYCTVVGTFDSKIKEYNESFAFVNLDTAQLMFSMYSEITNIEIFMERPHLSNFLSKQININLEKTNDVKSGKFLESNDWKSINKNLLETIDMQTLIMIMIFLFIIMMTALGIISNIIHLIYKKKREIAILRTIGASKVQILFLFLIIGNILSLIGLCFGVLLSYIFLKNINFIIQCISYVFTDLSTFVITEIDFDMIVVSKICGMIFIIVSIAAVYPAFRAANFSPSESLKDD